MTISELPFWTWALVLLAYLLGSIPFGLVLSKWVKGIDLRTFGSGNIGTTNAIRAMGRRWGLVVFALDFLKGFGPALGVLWLGYKHDHQMLAQVLVATASVAGHCYSIYLKFRGGKGVATGCGAIVAIDWRVFVCGGIVWLVARGLTGYSGLASILMGCTFPLVVLWLDPGETAMLVGAAFLMLLIVIRHRANIGRMIAGTEPRAGEKHNGPPKTPPTTAASTATKTESKARAHG